MRITNVKTFLVEGIKYNWTLLKIETDAGLHGWGEATNWLGSPLVEGDDLASNGALTEKQKRMEWQHVAPSLDYELEILSAQSFSQR